MGLNKPSGNMYPWAYTINFIGGPCHHGCSYCYVGRLVKRGVKRYSRDQEPFLVEKELKTNLTIPTDYVLFVCSCYDMFGSWVPREWIDKILAHCSEFPDTTFLFQSKNPYRFTEFADQFPPKTILGTTIESNRRYLGTKAVAPEIRFMRMMLPQLEKFRKMVSIEPIMDFDVGVMLKWLYAIKPEFVSIGADSGKNGLAEPSAKKIRSLIYKAEGFTEVRKKKNLNRLLGE